MENRTHKHWLQLESGRMIGCHTSIPAGMNALGLVGFQELPADPDIADPNSETLTIAKWLEAIRLDLEKNRLPIIAKFDTGSVFLQIGWGDPRIQYIIPAGSPNAYNSKHISGVLEEMKEMWNAKNPPENHITL